MTEVQNQLPSREDFEAYEEVRQSGEYNMIAEVRSAAYAAGLPMDRYRAVLKNYSALMAAYPDVRAAS